MLLEKNIFDNNIQGILVKRQLLNAFDETKDSPVRLTATQPHRTRPKKKSSKMNAKQQNAVQAMPHAMQQKHEE